MERMKTNENGLFYWNEQMKNVKHVKNLSFFYGFLVTPKRNPIHSRTFASFND